MEINQYITKKLLESNKKIKILTKCKNKAINRMIDCMLSESGRQLRLRLMLASVFYFNCENDISECAAVIELIQIAESAHGEIINKPDFRHRAVISEKFGIEAAVLLGDHIIYSILTKTNLDTQVRKMILDCISDVYEIRNNNKLFDLSITCEEYIESVIGKTAGVYGLSMKLGAFLGGADTEETEIFEKIGIIYGILFQINDDLLDIFSQTNENRKPVFYDFYNGIYTLPVIMARINRITQREMLKLQAKIKQNGMTDDDKDVLLGILRETNAFDKTYEKAGEFYEKGVELIKNLEDGGAKTHFLNYYNKIYKNIENKCKKRILEI